MVVVTSTTTKVHLNGDAEGGHAHTPATAQLASRPSSLFTRDGGGGRRGSGGAAEPTSGSHALLDSASRVGLDYIVENPDYVHKLASALESRSLAVKKQVFELLSALCVYNAEGYARTLQALDAFRAQIGERYRFRFLVAELQRSGGGATEDCDYKTSVLAFINCLILASPDTHERIRVRAEFIGLRLVHVLNELRATTRTRHSHEADAGLIIQLDVFEEQKESDESQQLARGIDLASPLDVFDAVLRQITGTPQETPFLRILQHLLSIDPKEPVSDLVWDAAERLVHRATLLETREDALRLLRQPSHAKSLQKLKADGKCACNCHTSSKPAGSTPVPPPPPPATTAVAAPAPPPPPPAPPSAPPPPTNPEGTAAFAKSQQPSKPLPKLPQQSLPPTPKAKMKTINWNKIPNGQILNGAGQNLWTTFSKKQASAGTLIDWQELEGLFCLQNEGPAPKICSPPDLPAVGKVNVREFAAARNGVSEATVPTPPSFQTQQAAPARREPSELILLDAKRSLNINIFLKQFRSSTTREIVDLILAGSSSEFGAERLRGLLKLLPSSDEAEMLGLVSGADQARLASAEKFLLALSGIEHCRLRVDAMLLREELELSLAHIDASIGAILTAAADLKASEHFQQVVFMILVAGNFLNSGGYAGDAAGVKLSSLQKIGDIRGNKPGISLLHFIVMQAEARDPKLVSFANEMPALEEASKTSIEQLKSEITSLNSKVHALSAQLGPSNERKVGRDLHQQYGAFLDTARAKLASIDSYFSHVEEARTDLAQFFCEELASFKLEDCLKTVAGFLGRWRDAAADNAKRRKQEAEAEARRKAREEQFRKRAMDDMRSGKSVGAGGGGAGGLHPDDELFIACSPRIVRRRLGSLASHDNGSGGSTQGSSDQLTLPSPDITPNGSIRKRRSRLSSDEDEGSGLMDFLRSGSGAGTPTTPGLVAGSPSMPRKLPGSIIDNQYGSLDRSWSRGTRRRPNLMEFVNSDRERPISPATHAHTVVEGGVGAGASGSAKGGGEVAGSMSTGEREHKHESPAREWRERISAWFVDLEKPVQPSRPPPRRFQSRFGDSVLGETTRGLATLPEVEPSNPDEQGAGPANSTTNYNDVYRTPFTSRSTTTASATPSTYERVYPDRRPSLKVNTDVVSAMETIEGAQTPAKEKSFWRSSSINSEKNGSTNGEPPSSAAKATANSRRTLIGSLGTRTPGDGQKGSNGQTDEKLTLYIPEGGRRGALPAGGSPLTRSPEIQESEFGTKEGFDRFASIRRSRRIKKPVDEPSSRPTSFGRAPPGPDTPMPTRRFVSKVDITDEPSTTGLFARTTKAGTLQRTTNAKAAGPARNAARSSSVIDSRQVDAALSLHKSSAPARGGVTPSNAIPIPRANGGGSVGSKHGTGNGSSLSSSPGGTTTSAENDEGFEESPNSLTETDRPTDSPLVLQNNALNSRLLRRSFRETGGGHSQAEEKTPALAHVGNGSAKGARSNGVFSIPLIRRKSMREANGSAVAAAGKTMVAANGGSTPAPYRNGGSEINYEPKRPTAGAATPAASKGRTPRILSFMRPTASSSAKDKLEAKVTGKGAHSPASTGLYSNKRAFK